MPTPGWCSVIRVGHRRWRWVAACVGVGALAALAWPQLYLVRGLGWPAVFGASAAAWIARGRWIDALLYAAAILVAAVFLEPVAGPLLLASLAMPVLAITARPRFSLAFGVAGCGLLAAAVAWKQRYAGSTLTWQDVRYFMVQFFDNVEALATEPTLLREVVPAVVIAVVGLIAAWRTDGLALKRPMPVPVISHAVALAVAIWAAGSLDSIAVRLSHGELWRVQTENHAPVSTFLSTAHLEPHAAYDQVSTSGFSDAVRKTMAASAAAPQAASDIVVFLQESQFNPARIAGCPAELCELPVFQPLPGTTDLGEARVHVFGGSTWLTEFEFATGVPHEVYGDAGAFASFNVAPGVQRSFIRSLKAAGYYTVAVYPTRGGMMNGRAAYKAYGFDEFLDAADLGMKGTFITPDAAMHRAALNTLQAARSHGKPVFLLALTIFNHADHGIWMSRVPAELRAELKRAVPDATEAEVLADYLWRTRQFEVAMERTRSELAPGRPTVLAWFGDHQPPFARSLALRAHVHAMSPRVPNRFSTWYSVWRNFGKAPAAQPQPQALDIVFLPGVLAQRAGVPLDDWLAANVVARERCAGLLAECARPHGDAEYLSYLLGDLHAIE